METHRNVAKYRTILPTARTLLRITSLRAAKAARREAAEEENQLVSLFPGEITFITYLQSSFQLGKREKQKKIDIRSINRKNEFDSRME